MIEAARNIDRNCHTRVRGSGTGISLSVRAVQPLLMYLTARGHDGAAFLKAQGVDANIFRDPEPVYGA